jgi:hypothetical protein
MKCFCMFKLYWIILSNTAHPIKGSRLCWCEELLTIHLSSMSTYSMCVAMRTCIVCRESAHFTFSTVFHSFRSSTAHAVLVFVKAD